jgi:cyanophycinase-like exopeptidase
MEATGGASRMPRLLCVMGSGETTPTMVSVHADLLTRLGPRPVPAVLLDTPFGFQENAEDISERTVAYFRDRVGFPITVASFRNRESATALEYETMLSRIAEARYVFAGPGSPSYALRQWLGTAVPELLAAKLRDGGCVTLASAAAVGIGMLALPVYEVYKVGEEPRWLEGLDLLSATGLRAAVIPHYNNSEGGTHDTRYCYMGERRLRILEELLPEGVDILGVDEHTAAIFDLHAATVSIRGRGGLTLRRRGRSQRFESGTTLPVSDLAAQGIASGDGGDATAAVDRDGGLAAELAPPPSGESPFLQEVSAQSAAADSALASRDVDAAVSAVLAIDTQMHDWSSDTLDSDEQDRAREILRRYVVRLGDLARNGAADPRDLIAPVVDGMLELRVQMRAAGEYALADRLRDVLVAAGVEVRDTPDGSTWVFGGATTPV